MNENEITTYENLWDAVIRGKFIVANTYIKKEERSQIINVTLRSWKMKIKLNPQLAEEKKMVKIREEINREQENRIIE